MNERLSDFLDFLSDMLFSRVLEVGRDQSSGPTTPKPNISTMREAALKFFSLVSCALLAPSKAQLLEWIDVKHRQCGIS